MCRSLFKGPIVQINLQSKQYLKRFQTILPEHINTNVLVHNGQRYINLKITEKMIGYKAGIFIFTRSKYKYKK